MTVRAIFSRCNFLFWVDIASYLEEKYNWEIKYWMGYKNLEKEVKQRFKGIVFHDVHAATHGIIPNECKHLNHFLLDHDLLKSLAEQESYALKMMDRIAQIGGFTYQDRVRMYHSQLKYWGSVLDFYKPDIVFFPTSPHLIYDYILFTLCPIFKVRTVMFERTSIIDLLIIMESFEQGSEDVFNEYKKAIGEKAFPKNISKQAEEYILKLSDSYDQAMPFHTKFKMQKYSGKKVGTLYTSKELAKQTNLTRIKDVSLKLAEFVKGNLPVTYDKRSSKQVDYQEMSRFKWLIYRLHDRYRAKMTRIALKSYYQSKAISVVPNEPFVFVCLQCQPERSTLPNGGRYADQLLMVELISKTIPDNWRICVKEHPSQFESYQNVYKGRSRKFYDELLAVHNVQFAPLGITSFELIDKSTAVATVSGTVGFEAVVRSRPTLLFGQSWYNGCEGVFRVQSEKECRNAIREIANGYIPNKNDVIKFIHVLETVGVHGYLDPIYQEASNMSYDQNVKSIASALGDFYNRGDAWSSVS